MLSEELLRLIVYITVTFCNAGYIPLHSVFVHCSRYLDFLHVRTVLTEVNRAVEHRTAYLPEPG